MNKYINKQARKFKARLEFQNFNPLIYIYFPLLLNQSEGRDMFNKRDLFGYH